MKSESRVRKLVVAKMSPWRLLVHLQTEKVKNNHISHLSPPWSALWWILIIRWDGLKRLCLVCTWASTSCRPVHDTRELLRKYTHQNSSARSLKPAYHSAALADSEHLQLVIHRCVADKAVRQWLPSAVIYVSLGFHTLWHWDRENCPAHALV